jgi:metallophosphoesterase superfamily enzyme
MPKIKYLILSDLHLGAANSVLTSLTPDLRGTEPHIPSELLKRFVACLHALLAANESAETQLVLNGDVMELALAGTNDAAMCFQGFIELLFDEEHAARLKQKVLCLPGNHDHHLWNIARETEYVTNYLAKAPPHEYLAPEKYVTRMYDDGTLNSVPINLLNGLIQRLPGLGQLQFEAVYPNYAVLNEERTRCVVMHHGHYVEPIYSLMTHIKEQLFPDPGAPPDIAELEAENAAWIDFFWSTMGGAGQVGADIELLYDKLQDRRKLSALLHNLSQAMVPKGKWLGSVKRPLLAMALSGVAGLLSHREPHKTEELLSPEAQRGLARYLERYLLPELQHGNNGMAPPEMTFIFGHTHKPFESLQRFDGYPSETPLVNSGGWVVDSLQPEPIHGAAVVIVDEALNVASIRMYQQYESPADYRVLVKPALGYLNPLASQLEEIVRPDEDPWKSFSEHIYTAILDHRQNLQYKVEE